MGLHDSIWRKETIIPQVSTVNLSDPGVLHPQVEPTSAKCMHAGEEKEYRTEHEQTFYFLINPSIILCT